MRKEPEFDTLKQAPGENEASLKSWGIIVALALLFAAWGLFLFFTVGDKGPAPWDFGAVRDVPGESPFSTERAVKGKIAEPLTQHVSEKPGKAPEK